MKAYPQYKDSGVPWLGYIPKHWEVLRLGSQFTERKQKVSDKDYAPLSVTKQGILPQLDSAAKSNDGDNRKKVCSGDFVINSRSDRKGSSGISPYMGSVSLINTVLTPISLNSRFVHRFFRSHAFQEEFYRVGSGIVADLWSTKYSDMRTIMIPVPSQDEQIQISRYLDWQISKINKFIKNKKKIITLLKEQKQNIINKAVTKGINSDVKMKDSGVSLLGDIPENWEVKKFGRCFSFGRGLPITKSDLISKGVAVISYGQIHAKSNSGTHISHDLIRYVNNEYLATKQQCLLNKNDFVFADTSEDIEGVGNYAFNDYELPVFAGYHVVIARPIKLSYPKFYAYLFQSTNWKLQVQTHVNGVKVYSINKGILRSTFILIPPLSEQRAIVDFLEKETALIDTTINRTEREIELIQEYRTRLVSDVVTGKVDVRSVEIPDFDSVEMEQEVEGDEETKDELITESIEE